MEEAYLTAGVFLLTAARYSFQDVVRGWIGTTIPKDKRLKFSESAWKFSYYLITWTWGTQVVLSQDFFWNTNLCWVGWPNIPMTESYKWFYMTQLSFYISSIITHVTIEVRRSDYTVMLVHHVAAVLLIAWSYYYNVHRIGGVLLMLHDINDIFLEAAKMANYAAKELLANTLFVIMIISWIISRLFLYSTKVILSSYFDVLEIIVPNFPAPHYSYIWLGFIVLLFTMLVLNAFWSFLMCRVAYNSIIGKKMVEDERER